MSESIVVISMAAAFTIGCSARVEPTFSNVPADKSVEANGPGGSIANYTKPTATDA